MDILRSLRSSALGRRAIALLGAGYIVLTHATTRWEVIGAENRRRVVDGEGRWIAALWHGRFLALPPEKTRQFRCFAVISNNKDGEIIAATARLFGVGALRGSTRDREKNQDKGGRQAFEGALAELAAGGNVVVAITPDGPRGPRQRCQHGVASLSVASGAAVIPVAYSVRRGVNLGSWDRMLLPWPFNSGVKIFGDPIPPPRDPGPEAVEAHRLAIETALNEITRRADEMCGRTPIEPAEPEA